jgi:hypothetical protein
MSGKHSLVTRARLGLTMVGVVILALPLAVAVPGAAAPTVGTFQHRASSPHPVNNVAVDPTTNMIYAQQFEGFGFYRYDPSTNKWTKLVKSPINQGNNGGAAYLNGKIYTVYTGNSTEMGVYNIHTGKWSTRGNPLGSGTGNITAVGSLLYLVDGFNFVSYNPATHATTPLASPPFDFTHYGGLAPYKGKIYGQQGDGSSGFADYNIKTDTWHALPDVPSGAVLGAAIDPVSGTFYAYGNYNQSNFYRFDIASGTWLSNRTFPKNVNDGGLAYVSIPGLQGIYATFGQDHPGFTRYVTKPRPHHH